MIEFTASNGVTVMELPDGQIGFKRAVPGTAYEYWAAWLTPGEAEAFAEVVAARGSADT